MINYYLRFLPDIAFKLAALHVKSAGRGKEITWIPQCQQAFEEAEITLSQASSCITLAQMLKLVLL